MCVEFIIHSFMLHKCSSS